MHAYMPGVRRHSHAPLAPHKRCTKDGATPTLSHPLRPPTSPPCRPIHPHSPHPPRPALQLGSTLAVYGRGFLLLDADAFTMAYMEKECAAFPWADYHRVRACPACARAHVRARVYVTPRAESPHGGLGLDRMRSVGPTAPSPPPPPPVLSLLAAFLPGLPPPPPRGLPGKPLPARRAAHSQPAPGRSTSMHSHSLHSQSHPALSPPPRQRDAHLRTHATCTHPGPPPRPPPLPPPPTRPRCWASCSPRCSSAGAACRGSCARRCWRPTPPAAATWTRTRCR